MGRLQYLLGYSSELNARLQAWLFYSEAGRRSLNDFLATRSLDDQLPAARIYKGLIATDSPPWFPERVEPIEGKFAEGNSPDQGNEWVLMSGPKGDFP